MTYAVSSGMLNSTIPYLSSLWDWWMRHGRCKRGTEVRQTVGEVWSIAHDIECVCVCSLPEELHMFDSANGVMYRHNGSKFIIHCYAICLHWKLCCSWDHAESFQGTFTRTYYLWLYATLFLAVRLLVVSEEDLTSISLFLGLRA